MTWVPNEKEIADVLAADGRHRYEYFIHRVCEARAVWALYNEGWASVGQDTGETMIPVWPHQAYANAFRTGPWVDFEPRKIDLEEFITTWLPGMQKEGLQPAVFPVPAGTSVIVTAEDLDANLRHELEDVHGVEL